MAYVYPSLPIERAGTLLEKVESLDPEELRARSDTSHPAAGYYPTGPRVPEQRVSDVAHAIRHLVDSLGFPSPRRTKDAFTEFDHRLPELLCSQMEIVPADAADEGVWSFLSLVVLPDIAVWRYPDRTRERMLGMPRNVFRRLWWRGYVLGPGATDPPAVLGEDQLVAIMERPTIGGHPRLARAFSRAVIETQQKHGELSPMFLMRESAKRLIRLLPFLSLDALPADEADSVLGGVVTAAAGAIASVDNR